jgi:hypothetical protein
MGYRIFGPSLFGYTPSYQFLGSVAKPVRNYVKKLEKVCEISLRFQPFNIITIHPHSFKTITRFPFYFPSSFHLLKLIILFFLNKLVGTSILKIELKIMSGEKKKLRSSESAF